MPGTENGLDFGRYHVQQLLGRGGMGEVYRAHDIDLNRDVAIKFVATDKLTDPDARARLLREARAAAGLDHPAICPVYEAGETPDGRAFIVMQLVDGRPLSEMAANGPLPVREALGYAVQIAEALSAAHRRGVVHRDLKPGNVMVDAAGRVRLLDFGIAKVIASPDIAADLSTTSVQTTGNKLLGTPGYMSPEQIQQRPLDGRSDLFSLGVLLYECLTGRRPFNARTPVETVANVLHVQLPPPSTLREGLNDRHDALCERLLAKEPADRFQSADEVVGAIRLLLQDTSHVTGPIVVDDGRGGRLVFRWLIAAVVVLLGFIAWRTTRPTGLPPVPAEAQLWYQRGTEAIREGAYLRARSNLEEATRLFDRHALAYARLAEADTELDDESAAQRRLLRLSDLVPDESRLAKDEGLRVRAVRGLVLHNPDTAITAYRELTARHPDDAGVWVDLGRAQEAAGLRTDAAASYRRAIEQDAQYAPAYLRLGTVDGLAAHIDNALNAFAEAERLYTAASSNEGLTEVLLRRGAALDASSDSKRARVDLERALSLATTAKSTGQRVRAQLALSSVVATEGHSSEAQRMAQSAVADATAAGLDTAAAEGLTSLSATFAEKGLLDQAEAEAEKAVKIANERGAKRTLAWARLQLAEARRLQGHQADAIVIVDDVLPFLRKNRYRRFELFALLIAARAHDQLGQLEQSRQMSSDVLAMADTLHDDGRAAIAASDLARVTALLGQYHDALALRERAEATYRRLGDELALPYALGNHAELLIRLGRRADANRVLSELEAGIERGIEAYVGRTRRAAFLRGFSAATALRCDEALRDLSRVSPQPGGNEQTSVVAPAVTAFCEARVGRPAAPVPPAPSNADAADIAERAYWLSMAGLSRNDAAASRAAAAEGLAALGSLANGELRWRLSALDGIASRNSTNQSAVAGRLEEARAALELVRRAFAGDATSYDARPDLVYVRKLAGLM
jgi:tetratricopeptide (TPR) repeat protein/predicted Ser/Thr protein kinase